MKSRHTAALALVGPPVTSDGRIQKDAPLSQDALDRTVLPLAEPTYPPITELDVRKATPPPRFEVKASDGAPNVVVILLDNLGFGATKPFGGVINMPTLERFRDKGSLMPTDLESVLQKDAWPHLRLLGHALYRGRR
jgi:hypothetical protein